MLCDLGCSTAWRGARDGGNQPGFQATLPRLFWGKFCPFLYFRVLATSGAQAGGSQSMVAGNDEGL